MNHDVIIIVHMTIYRTKFYIKFVEILTFEPISAGPDYTGIK